MSNLVGNHIVGFPTRRLKYKGNTHYENMSMQHVQYTDIFPVVKKNEHFQYIFLLYFSYFCSKHRLWVHVEVALTSTHSLCFGAKIRKIGTLL